MKQTPLAEQLLTNIANNLAAQAADALEPLAGRPFTPEQRASLESGFLAVLLAEAPGLVHLVQCETVA